jgi:hypothetical protein
MRWILVTLSVLLVIFALGFLYIGSTHRDRCIRDGNVGCSLLPWSGRSPYLMQGGSGDTQGVTIP